MYLRAVPKKKSPQPIDARWGHRLPSPLPLLSVDDPFVARVQAYLRAGGGDAEVEQALRSPSPEVRAFLLRFLAMPESADIGVAPWSQSLYDTLAPAERRAYSRAHRVVETARSPRVWGLYFAVRALAACPEGRALARAHFLAADTGTREQIARALFDAREHLGNEDLEVLATLLDGEATPEAMRALGYGAWAAYHLDPSSAFERLSPRLDAAATDHSAGVQRALALLITLGREAGVDPRWAAAIRPLLRDRVLGAQSVWTLEVLPLDASWAEDLLAYLHLDPRMVNVFDVQAMKLLARLGEVRAVGVFVEALAKNSTAREVVLDAYERLPDPRLDEALRAWVSRHEREGVPEDWPPLVRARALLARG